ncbi:nitrite reductase NAD(P)H small subunit [Collibacillus ludicampi]|jgi:nitrite reductase (NADH) small subunit|uniref:Nitrite reductase NAD(P)H small subunit n=1 Tax=Collibacillus ludicampi TaxID=2771369 RepID=A0AAV4LG06_9BACL|nr:nitrite reductase small subunit NirD [Collibacillus ludicampi]GIM46757.1 nitrite reductase NAD(P)H small subunit [Collibacillus ludicampi]
MRRIEVYLHDIPVQLGRVIRVGQREIALFRLSNGEIRALENRCPHKGGSLAEGIISGEYVFCPLHDRKINLSDGKVQEPDTGCVRAYQVEIDKDKVFIYT